MSPPDWREMVDRTREMELALGRADKRVCENERETVVVQRRCVRAKVPLKAGTILTREMLSVLRPAPPAGIPANAVDDVVGRRVTADVPAGEHLTWSSLGDASR
jgi:N-acetylneuraminate synthase